MTTPIYLERSGGVLRRHTIRVFAALHLQHIKATTCAMINAPKLIFALLLLAAPTATQATEQFKGPVALDGPAIIKTFEGKTVKGAYANGTPVQETYFLGGAIDYWDSYNTSKGKWSVVNNLFCTFYDIGEMGGGCFRVEQVSANCFDYFAVANSPEEALKPADEPRYTARASIMGLPETCPDELSV
jgi:hypothetical protein